MYIHAHIKINAHTGYIKQMHARMHSLILQTYHFARLCTHAYNRHNYDDLILYYNAI